MHGFTPSIPLGTEVGPLQVPKGCGVQVGGGLMTIGPWPRACPELVEGFWFLASGWPARGDGKAEREPPENCSPGLSTGRFTRSRQGGPKRAASDSTARATGGCHWP